MWVKIPVFRIMHAAAATSEAEVNTLNADIKKRLQAIYEYLGFPTSLSRVLFSCIT